MYVVESRGVAVSSRSSTVQKAKRLIQVVRLGVPGRQATSRVRSPARTIQDRGYRVYFNALYTPYHRGVRSITTPS
jgi:hypothetical protein